MCLEVFAVPATENRVSARRLAEVSGLRVIKSKHPLVGALHFSRDGGCSCSLANDDGPSDPTAPTWILDPVVLDGLAAALTILSRDADGFLFEARWSGEEPQTTTRESLDSVLASIRENRIRNHHRYTVGRARPVQES
jgi:hypothetical protein